MQRIPIKFAKPGFILGKEAITPEGQVLCGSDTELTEDLILRLKKQGVLVLTIKGHPVRLPGELPLSERLRELDRRFSKVKKDPVLKALETLIGEFWIEQEKGKDYLKRLKTQKS